ncbi:MAG TPA: cupredoxin domain-containing protein [Acidimicrobiales bacterium]|nr:cupredoxin domain-containing protein [Acidimicrobiales bacterium]
MRVGRVGLVAAVALAAAVACSTSDTANAVGIVATDTECRVDRTDLASGRQSFKVNNQGDKVTEVYVYGEGDEVIAEKENIGPGTSVTFSADLSAGKYQIACKPGQTGKGIRQEITVSGAP